MLHKDPGVSTKLWWGSWSLISNEYRDEWAHGLMEEVEEGVGRRQDAVLVQILPPNAGPLELEKKML